MVGPARFPDDLVVVPICRWPTTLAAESLRVVLETPINQRVPERPAANGGRPRASIVVVTLDGLVFTRLCLESLLASISSVDSEVVVIDNGSTDGSVRYLNELSGRDARVRVTCQNRNIGFAAAVNCGVALAHGDIVILLNNDTIVIDGWLERIVTHLADPRVGLLGAVTNRAGNEAEIQVPYRTYGALRRFARDYMQAHSGQAFDIRTATMFCAALRRQVWDAIGPLDERFETALFEDDDYAMRVRQAGYRVACAEDVFVHHFGQASIGQLGPTGRYGDVFHANRLRWEAKWGVAWQPYERRDKPAYRDLIQRIRCLVRDAVPAGATVAVISRGDDELLKLDGRQAWHFPQCEDGTYAGHHPKDSVACIAHVEQLRSKGAEFLVIPSTALWWLEHYARFGEHLTTHYRALGDEHSPAIIVALTERPIQQPLARHRG